MPLTDDLVVSIKSVITLRPSFWRHPILWWKTRHLLPDMERHQEEIDELMGPEFRREFDRKLEEQIFFGRCD